MPRRPLRVALAALALGSALAACDPGGPDGLDGVLFFRRSTWSPCAGDTWTLTIPDHVKVGDYWMGKGLYYYGRTFDYRFDGTTVEVTPPPYLSVLGATLDPAGWTITLRCDAAGSGEVSVRVLEGSVQRYADRTWADCYAAPAP